MVSCRRTKAHEWFYLLAAVRHCSCVVVSDDVDLNSVAAIPGMGIPEQLKAAMEQEQSSKSHPRTARNSQQVSRIQRKKARKFQTCFSTQIQTAERKQEEQSERDAEHLFSPIYPDTNQYV